jgi:hypothetical protein
MIDEVPSYIRSCSFLVSDSENRRGRCLFMSLLGVIAPDVLSRISARVTDVFLVLAALTFR